MIFIVPPWVSFDTGKNVLKIANEPICIIMSCDGTHSRTKQNRTKTKGCNGFQQEERNTERSNLHGNDTICGWKLRAKNRFITTQQFDRERHTHTTSGRKGRNVVFIHVLSTHICRLVEAKFEFYMRERKIKTRAEACTWNCVKWGNDILPTALFMQIIMLCKWMMKIWLIYEVISDPEVFNVCQD